MPAGYHGAYIDPFSTNQSEKEYLLNSSEKMVVTKIQKVNDTQTGKLFSVHVKDAKNLTKKPQIHHYQHTEKGSYQLVTLNVVG